MPAPSTLQTPTTRIHAGRSEHPLPRGEEVFVLELSARYEGSVVPGVVLLALTRRDIIQLVNAGRELVNPFHRFEVVAPGAKCTCSVGFAEATNVKPPLS